MTQYERRDSAIGPASIRPTWGIGGLLRTRARRALVLIPAIALAFGAVSSAPAAASAASVCGVRYQVTNSNPIDVAVRGTNYRVGTAFVARDFTNSDYTCEYAELDLTALPSDGNIIALVAGVRKTATFSRTDRYVTSPVFKLVTRTSDTFSIQVSGSYQERVTRTVDAPVTTVTPKTSKQKARAKAAYKKAVKKAKRIKAKSKRSKALTAAKRKYKAALRPTTSVTPGSRVETVDGELIPWSGSTFIYF